MRTRRYGWGCGRGGRATFPLLPIGVNSMSAREGSQPPILSPALKNVKATSWGRTIRNKPPERNPPPELYVVSPRTTSPSTGTEWGDNAPLAPRRQIRGQSTSLHQYRRGLWFAMVHVIDRESYENRENRKIIKRATSCGREGSDRDGAPGSRTSTEYPIRPFSPAGHFPAQGGLAAQPAFCSLMSQRPCLRRKKKPYFFPCP